MNQPKKAGNILNFSFFVFKFEKYVLYMTSKYNIQLHEHGMVFVISERNNWVGLTCCKIKTEYLYFIVSIITALSH